MSLVSWDLVEPGDSLRDDKGRVWDVLEVRNDGQVVMESGRRKVGPFAPKAQQVERVFAARQARSAALALVDRVLGGDVLSVETEGRVWCPAHYTHPGALLAHILTGHGVEAVAADLTALQARHATLHDARGGYDDGYVAHEHDIRWQSR